MSRYVVIDEDQSSDMLVIQYEQKYNRVFDYKIQIYIGHYARSFHLL